METVEGKNWLQEIAVLTFQYQFTREVDEFFSIVCEVGYGWFFFKVFLFISLLTCYIRNWWMHAIANTYTFKQLEKLLPH